VTFLALTVSLASATTASAHAALVSSDPADSTTLPTNPSRVTATFNEDMQPAFAAMTVIGPDGSQWSEGEVDVVGPSLGIAVRQGAPAGDYTVNYRATSADGHVVSGAWSYTVTEPAPPATGETGAESPAPAATTTAAPATSPASTDDGVPVWPFIVGAVVIVAGGAVWAVRRRS
jgi:methionine-rich copper-binding protein CopC